MNKVVDIIINATAQVFGVSVERLCERTRDREIIVARRASAWVCRKEGVPARMLAERYGVSRWCVNRMQSEASKSKDAFFLIHVKELERRISTLKAHEKLG